MLSQRRCRGPGWPMLCLGLLATAFIMFPQQADAARNGAAHHDRTDKYLSLPVQVITMTTLDEEESELFQLSFNRTRNIDTPMDLDIVRLRRDKFLELGWKSKVLYVLKSLRKVPHHQMVILADSRDLVWLPCGRDLRDVFKEFDHDIVIGACPYQYPDRYKEDLFPNIPKLKPEIPFTEMSKREFLRHKYINAGFLMGRAGALLHYLGGAFLRYNVVDRPGHFDDQTFWANMYLAQFYDDAASASKHPSIVIDAGMMLVNLGSLTYAPVGDTGYWQSDMSRFTTCIAHAPGGAANYEPLHNFYRTSMSKSFDYEAVQRTAAKASAASELE